MVATFACAASSIPFGIWLLATSKWPSWMKGSWRWPLGSHLSKQVINLQGWANLFIGAASLVLAVLCVFFPALLASETLPVGWIVGGILSLAMLFLVCGLVPYVRGVRLSYRDPSGSLI